LSDAELASSDITQADKGAEPDSVVVSQAEADQDSVGESSPQEKPEAIRDFVVGAPLEHENLSIFPVMSRLPLTADRFVTLEEGLRTGKVEIFERGASLTAPSEASGQQRNPRERGNRSKPARDRTRSPQSANQAVADLQTGDEVNRLTVINRAAKPLYLMPGEVIVGGSQDRTISDETVIAATEKPIPISVYCVEHGRWSRRGAEQTAMMLADLGDPSSNPEKLAAEAARGKFVAKGGFLGKSGRMVAQAGDGQQKIWEKVAEANSKSRVTSSSGAFTANFIDKTVTHQLQPYIDSLTDPIAKQERVVGVVVAVNGKIESADIFESTPLFLKLWPKLVKCYALDALHAVNAAVSQNPCSAADATTFLDALTQGQANETKRAGGGLVVTKRSNRESFSFLAMEAPSADAPPIGQGGFGGAVHAVGFAKPK
jgi:hypothetical protein